ncbi:putative dihydrodipicolinate synthase [Mycena floridula]|nr:putative dihydrodipicolinate synthase [Mycena floridula]
MRPLTPGVYVPLPVFFDDNEDLDLLGFKAHVTYTAKAGIKPVVSGSMGEAVHLNHKERATLVKAAREALDEAGLTDFPVMAGAGGASTRETIEFAKEAAEAGADYVIVISPGYYAGALMQDSYAAIKQYFVDVAAGSPVPVMMYNFPAVTGGLDMDSDLIQDIAKSAPNVCGIKLTCGAVGKLTRVAAMSTSPSFVEQYPRKDASAPFLVLDGFIDILMPSAAAGAAGTITGIANFAPLVCGRLWELLQAPPSAQVLKEARDLQAIVSRADWAASKGNVPGMKYLLNKLFGYNARPRRPFLTTSQAKGDALVNSPDIIAILELEKQLAQKA